MESEHRPKVFIRYSRRRRPPNPQQQEAPISLDNVVLDLPAASSGDQKEDSMHELPSEALHNTDRHATRKGKRKADSSDFIYYMPNSHGCGQRSRSLHGSNSHQCGTRKRKGKDDSSDFEDYMPNFCGRGQRRGSLHGSNSHRRGARKREDKDDSSDSEIYAPCPRVRGQRRNLLHCTNSITQQWMLSTETFQLYFENIWSRISEEKRSSFAYLDSLWFSLYTNNYTEKVLNWIKKKDIFSKKYVLVPIILWSHWSLLILCHFGEESKSSSPSMVLLDSLQLANQNLEPQIRRFVLDIHKTDESSANRESIKKIPLLVPKVPQQRNGEECGCYVLFYANLFLENAPESFNISDGYPYFMKEDWFTVESLDGFRRKLGLVPAKSSGLDE